MAFVEPLAITTLAPGTKLSSGRPAPRKRWGCHQLGLVITGRPRQSARVDEVLTTPDINRLLADAEVVSNLPDRPTGFDEIEDLAPELSRVTTVQSSLLEGLEHHPSSKMTPPDPGHITSLPNPERFIVMSASAHRVPGRCREESAVASPHGVRTTVPTAKWHRFGAWAPPQP